MDVLTEILNTYGNGLVLLVLLFMWYHFEKRMDAIENRMGKIEECIVSINLLLTDMNGRLSRLEERVYKLEYFPGPASPGGLENAAMVGA